MANNRGIRVPADPNVDVQEYQGSVVTEYFNHMSDSDRRVEQLTALGRNPLQYTSFALPHIDGEKTVKRFAVRWTEPRGEELAKLGEVV